ncbi:DNA topoisomerase III [Salirhabdus salicampi]|uniref:DNA topoisomerase III n=1 Tax=Salirhabdus salicampi TaxID=476102 RepID=UPI0020C21BC1|nr:DNA topoisomerase III [Salirhabdus salicampi]MCP8616294.1 DNA topoisomerase III [Salirhabdus salicampi]
MKKAVVLAEKPSVARDIARVLNCHKKGNGFMEGEKYIVTWALGHLVTLADPEIYDDKYKSWRLEELPMLPKELKLVVIKKTSKQFHTVKKQLHRADVKEIIVATDSGREGQLVAEWILEKAKIQKPTKRLWISSVTDKAIKQGFQKLKNNNEYKPLFDAAVARSEADWYVGLNATRALTTKYNAQLSSGRVQTPTLAMIATREEEIKAFTPKTYYGLEAKSNEVSFTWHDENNNARTFSKDKVEKIKNTIEGKYGKIIHIDRVAKQKYAPQLYDLTELQRDANRLFGFSGKQTLSIMQKLYEHHKVLTYPRTDSRVISSDIVPTLRERVKACGVEHYAKVAKKVLQRKEWKLPKSVVDNAKVTDHHAIIPTEQSVFLKDLNDKERKVYDLVVKRFLAVLSEPYQYDKTTIQLSIGKELFSATGIMVRQLGWKEIYGETSSDQSNSSFREFQEGEEIKELRILITSGETKPSSRFTEGELLQAMESPSRFMNHSEKHLAGTLNKSGGIGTVATRADIIEKLFQSSYVEKKGKYIYITSKGKQLLDLVPEDLQSPALTAVWEQKLNQIAEGKLSRNDFITEIKDYTKEIVKEIKNNQAKFKHDNITGTKCPGCGKLMLEVNNKNGKMLVCQDRSCGHKKNIAKKTNARCPNCHKRLELRGEGEGQTFTCKCGHREKLSAFNKRKQREKQQKVSKKDVNKYLKKQDDGFSNNALAEALSKFKTKE